MKIVLRIVLILLAIPTLATAAFFAVGTERVWELAAGPADQGAVEVTTLARRAKPTDSLACTPGICAGRTDLSLPVYRQSPAALLQSLDAIVLSDARNLTRVDDGTRPDYRRYVARTKTMRFPDTIDAMALPSGGGTGLALYGRSQLGTGDWGVNRGRIEGWVERLGVPRPEALKTAEPPIS